MAAATDQLAQARAAVGRYRFLADAVGDGYLPSGGCVQDARGAGGFHYVNQARLGTLDPMHPPELLYVPVDGTLALAGAEWYAPAAGAAAAPVLFGHPFDGPMPGHHPGQPDHYDLHAWLFVDNPAGMFAPFDPALSC